MPAKSNKQLRFIYAKRGQYKNKKSTPSKWKWIWNDEWLHVRESIILSFNDFTKILKP